MVSWCRDGENTARPRKRRSVRAEPLSPDPHGAGQPGTRGSIPGMLTEAFPPPLLLVLRVLLLVMRSEVVENLRGSLLGMRRCGRQCGPRGSRARRPWKAGSVATSRGAGMKTTVMRTRHLRRPRQRRRIWKRGQGIPARAKARTRTGLMRERYGLTVRRKEAYRARAGEGSAYPSATEVSSS